MASYGDGTNGNYGHVMIVEQIVTAPDGHMRVRVSEMNIGGNDIANAGDYTDTRWWSKQPDGTWTREGDSKHVSMTFATFPG